MSNLQYIIKKIIIMVKLVVIQPYLYYNIRKEQILKEI